MANDIFGDESLFSEFDRDRETQNIFIHFDQDASGAENRSRIVFRSAESDADESDDEDENETESAMQTTEDPEATRKGNGEDQALASGEADVVGPEVKEEAAETETNGEGQGGAPQTTSYQEQFEKNKYRRFARLIDSTRCVSDEQSPGVQILFQNNKFARKYRSRIEQFIISLTQHADKKDFSKTATDLSGRAAVPTCVDINDSLPTEKRNNRMWQSHGIIGCAQFHYGFMVDSRGWPHDADEPAEYTSGELPKYFQVFDQVFPVDESKAVSDKPAKPKDSCFNCGGDHRLTECKTPKDHGRIRAKRQEHRDRSGNNRSSNPGRYHKDPELDPQRARFQAGVISDSLREAIGLKPNQLPSYIYRMRLFGYPPGWLMEANRKTSMLAMYDKDGNETNLRGESLEDGEYGEQSPTEPSEMFDLNKIIEYPGFTVPVPLGFIDESDSIGMPPIQQHQLKKTLMEDMVAKETARKRRLVEEDEAEKSKKQKTGEDMEIGEDEEATAAPVETSTPTESEKTGKVEEEEEGEAKDRDDTASPTMDTLQQEYKILVQQLDSEGETTLANGSSADTAGAAPSDTPKKSPCESELIRQKNVSFTSSTSISKDYGTPILIRDKSFQALPSPEKFGQGIEDHIPFENLPDSVGTFDRMKNLFTIIRNKVKKLKK